ncbi:protein of unknown function [Xenorhabdus nematophila AN6/1]|nr:hypothetical protein XNA1_1670041 [Xenorhabdus nematophila str. Anatoliense]CEE92986.1 hypothetical protein XNA1_3210041 [Xenorhabdus nematophila str. Anatoliense]CEF33247.1 hypothetical protein XNW1_4700009 [Xenorhabdus nematophila str. Websteri]CEK24755.1 protein of unknown function [Xenorhabdus nematophila AN6/1]
MLLLNHDYSGFFKGIFVNTDFRIATAQFCPVSGNINKNIKRHNT